MRFGGDLASRERLAGNIKKSLSGVFLTSEQHAEEDTSYLRASEAHLEQVVLNATFPTSKALLHAGTYPKILSNQSNIHKNLPLLFR